MSMCGTTRCVAGWVAAFQPDLLAEVVGQRRVEEDYYHEDLDDPGLALDYTAEEVGAIGLGLDPHNAYTLFHNTTEAEALHALEFLAKGQAIDWAEVGHTRQAW